MATQTQPLEWWQAALLNLTNQATGQGVNTGAYTRYETDPQGNLVTQGAAAGTTYAPGAASDGAAIVIVGLLVAVLWLWKRG